MGAGYPSRQILIEKRFLRESNNVTEIRMSEASKDISGHENIVKTIAWR